MLGILVGRISKKRYYTRLPLRFYDTELICKYCWEHPTKKGKYFVLVGINGTDDFIIFLNIQRLTVGELCWQYSAQNALYDKYDVVL